MKYALTLTLVALSVAGCATLWAGATRSTEQMLAAAGFHMEPATTPEARAELQTLKPRRLVARPGPVPTWVYADPDVCNCLYVGDEYAYQRYQRLALQQELMDAQINAANTGARYGTPWPWW
jgi:hypothetical protein